MTPILLYEICLALKRHDQPLRYSHLYHLRDSCPFTMGSNYFRWSMEGTPSYLIGQLRDVGFNTAGWESRIDNYE